jgi:transposase InsO family protein
VRDLIARISQENRLWDTERIRGELLKLGIVVSNRSIRRYRWRKPTRGGTQRWRTFLSNEIRGIWAADLLVVHTINYRILYVFFFISHERRELIHFNVTTSPTAAWIWQQLLEATPWGRKPAYLIHDRDSVYGRDFDARANRLGIAGVRTPPRAPKANSIAERLVETIRTECLDYVIVVNEGHLRRVLAEFMHYYNHDRPHRTLSLQSPAPETSPGHGLVVSTPMLGGLHHACARAAGTRMTFCRPTP